MSEPEKRKGAIDESGLGGRKGFLIGLAILCALALAGAYFSYRFYSESGQSPMRLTVEPAAQK